MGATGTEANEPGGEAVVWMTDGAAGKAAAKTGEGGAGMAAGGGTTGCRAGAGAARVTESSGGAGRSGVGISGAWPGGDNFACSVDGRDATRGNGNVFFALVAAAGTDTAAGTCNCTAMYRGGCDSNGERTCKTIKRMPRWMATLPAREANRGRGADSVA
jgi:hypothetical protein